MQNQTDLITQTTSAAKKLFKGLPVRVWYFKITEGSWKCIIVHEDTKIKLAQGAIKKSPEAAINAVRTQLENIVGRRKTS